VFYAGKRIQTLYSSEGRAIVDVAESGFAHESTRAQAMQKSVSDDLFSESVVGHLFMPL
jgi:hypothetical protein